MAPLERLAACRGWLRALCAAVCAGLAAARTYAEAGDAKEKTGPLLLGCVASAVALVAQLLFLPPASEAATKGSAKDASTDCTLTWREDEGVSKLVPLVPDVKGGEDRPRGKYTMAEVAKHNSLADLWIIVDGCVYDVTRYVPKHPGGFLPLQNMAGKDCTDVFANYHSARIYKHMLPPFLIGTVTDYSVPAHVADFREVRQELLRRGLFQTDLRYYGKMGSWYAFLFLTALWLSLGCSSVSARLAGAAVMGLFWQQLAGVGHDLGHSGVTHVFWLDHVIGSTLVAFMGISVCWWKKNHNTHHVVCNSVEHDPDIQHMPAFAVTTGIFKKPFWSTYYTKWVNMDAIARFMVGHQHILFYPIMMVARVNLYAQSLIQLFSREMAHYRKYELAMFCVYFGWLSALLYSMPSWKVAVGWMLVSHAVSGLLHVQICASHFSMDTYHGHAYNDEKDEWYITQLKTTLNFDTWPVMDWFHIGLQFQIEHHMYPRLPRHNLREARLLVKAVCEKHGIPYHEMGFIQANLKTLRCMRNVALEARKTKRGDSGFYQCALMDGLNLHG